jgi:hypothetical protein
VGGKRVAALRLGHLGGEALDRVDAPDEHVAQRLAAGFGVVDGLDRLGDGTGIAVRGGHGMHDGHRLLPAAGGGDDRFPVGVLLEVPLGEGLVVAAFARMQDAGGGLGVRRRRLVASRGGVSVLFDVVPALGPHRHDQGAVGVTNDVHGASPRVEGQSDPPRGPARSNPLAETLQTGLQGLTTGL